MPIALNARALIAVSDNSRRDAIQVLGIPEDRIVAIYPGVASRFFDVPRDEIDRVRTRLRLTRPYVLSVGTIEPRKNTDRLLAAWSALRSLPEENSTWYLRVLWDGLPRRPKRPCIRRRTMDGPVRYLGYVADRTLRA